MSEFLDNLLNGINYKSLYEASIDTLYMTLASLVVAVILGFMLGIIVYTTQKDGLYENEKVSKAMDFLINILRSIPYIILLFILMPFAKALIGTSLGATAALPSLIISSAPFYARMCVIALNEIDKGVIEASKAMGATNRQIILKVLIPESKPALVSSITVMGVSLIGYTAMAGAIGAGGLGYFAYLYGAARQNTVATYVSTFIILIFVFIIQGIGDHIVKKIDKR
ncbi:methionine ABC transporter permease [Tannockella kyphosi]|uniref:methionine ABC transporter permease n=1 Tax=Tannockella kyphosi TaxID=2899121 RepID=UPI0020117844|nr:methionine ABC transporter permease [Tannockella kyphosi]